MYKCGWNGCEKAYGTLNHLNAHVTMQSHGSKRTPEGEFPMCICWSRHVRCLRSVVACALHQTWCRDRLFGQAACVGASSQASPCLMASATLTYRSRGIPLHEANSCVLQSSKKFGRNGKQRKRRKRMRARRTRTGSARRCNARVKIRLKPKVSLPNTASHT